MARQYQASGPSIIDKIARLRQDRRMDLGEFITPLGKIVPWLENTATWLSQPWQIYQIAFLAFAMLVAHLIARRIRPGMREWMRNQNTNMARLRALVVIERRLRPLILIAILWLAVLILRSATWPSRSYIITLVATLITAWVFVAIFTRLIRNNLARSVVRWTATIIVTLQILGLLSHTMETLDQFAFTFGETRLTVLVVIKALLTLAVLLVAANWLVRLAAGRIEAVEDVSPSMKVLADKLLRIFIYTIAVILGLQSVGFDMTNLTVLSGAIGLGLGFGLQKIVSNLVSGVILLLDKSIKPGDVISLGETFGWITTLGARYVSVVTRDGREYLIPNEDLITSQVVNWSHSSDLVRLDIHFGVTYDADPHFVRKIAVDAAKTVQRVADLPAPVCHLTGFGDSSVDFILRFWIHDPNAGLTNVRGAVFLALWDTLKEHEIEIPFPKRDVTILNPERSPPMSSFND